MKIDGYRPQQTQTVKPAQAQLQGVKNETLNSLRPGETVTVTVAEATPKGLLLNMPDGTQVTATRNAPLDVRPGDKLEMTITGKSGGQVLVEMNMPKNTDPAALLRAFGAEASPENMEILREFLKNGVAPTRENFNAIRSMLSEFNTLSPDKAAFMIKNEIPVNEQNITMFQNFLNNEAQLGGKLMELHSLLESLDPKNMPDAQASAQTTPAAMTGAPDAAATQGNQQTTQTAEQPVPGQYTRNEAGINAQAITAQPEAEALAQSKDAAAASPEARAQTAAAEQPLTDAANNTQRGAEAARPDTQAQAPQTSGFGTAAAAEETPDKPNVALTDRGQGTPPDNGRAANAAAQGTPAATADTEAARGTNVQKEVQVTAQNAPERAADATLTREGTVTELKDMVKDLFKQIDDTNSRAFARQMEAPRVVREITSVLNLIGSRIDEMNESQRSQATSIMRDIAQHLKFTEHLNNYTAFAQIPLMMNGNPTTANMYVWGDGKGKRKIDPENSTIFLSLSTANIGRVESYVKIIGKNVECDFKLESMDTLKLIQGNISKLGTMLQGEGYRLSRVSFYESDKASNVLDLMETRSKETRRFNFDMKV